MVSRTTLFGLAFCVVAAAGATAAAYFLQSEKEERMAPARLLLPDIGRYDAFECRTGAIDVLCRKSGSGEWRVERPFAARANAEAVQRFLDGVSCGEVLEQIPGSRRRKRRIDEAVSEVAAFVFTGAYGERATVSLKSTGDGAFLYADGNLPGVSAGSLLSLDPKLLHQLPRAAEEFRDNRLVPYPENRVGRVEIRKDGVTQATLYHGTAGWTVAGCGEWAPAPDGAPATFPGNEAEIGRFLRYLVNQRFTALRRDGAPSQELLDNARCNTTNALCSVRLRIDGAEGASFDRELLFGTAVLADEEAGADVRDPVYVHIPDDGVLAAVDGSLLATFPDGAGRFREHLLFAKAASAGLASIRAQDGQGGVTLFQRGDAPDSWKLVQPARLDVEPAPFRAFLKSLASLSDIRLESGLPKGDPSGTGAAEDGPAADLLATLEIKDLGGGCATARVYRAVSPEETLWAVEGEPYVRVVANAALRLRPWAEPDVLPLLKPEIPPEIPARIEALAPPSVKDFGLLSTEDMRALAAEGDATNGMSRVLLLGGATPTGDRYAMVRGAYTVYSVPTNHLETLPVFQSTPAPQSDTP